MVKKSLLVLILILLLAQITMAKELQVKIYSPTKITTSNPYLQEGDNINFVLAEDLYLNSKPYLKKGEIVTGVITNITNNSFVCKEASIYAENFKVKNVNGKLVSLNGVIYKKGHTHELFTQFIPFVPEIIRGGEVQIKPQKDTFILYFEDNL